jgi:hypothetical protein
LPVVLLFDALGVVSVQLFALGLLHPLLVVVTVPATTTPDGNPDVVNVKPIAAEAGVAATTSPPRTTIAAIDARESFRRPHTMLNSLISTAAASCTEVHGHLYR